MFVVYLWFQRSLQEQLSDYGGGFELITFSNLPHGSGLGTSSILAGAVMGALWQVSGRKFDVVALNHAVSRILILCTVVSNTVWYSPTQITGNNIH